MTVNLKRYHKPQQTPDYERWITTEQRIFKRDKMENVESNFRVEPVRNKYHVQIWNHSRGWVDYFGHKYKCRIEAQDAERGIVASFEGGEK